MRRTLLDKQGRLGGKVQALRNIVTIWLKVPGVSYRPCQTSVVSVWNYSRFFPVEHSSWMCAPCAEWEVSRIPTLQSKSFLAASSANLTNFFPMPFCQQATRNIPRCSKQRWCWNGKNQDLSKESWGHSWGSVLGIPTHLQKANTWPDLRLHLNKC